jgi:adenosine deaminase
VDGDGVVTASSTLTFNETYDYDVTITVKTDDGGFTNSVALEVEEYVAVADLTLESSQDLEEDTSGNLFYSMELNELLTLEVDFDPWPTNR